MSYNENAMPNDEIEPPKYLCQNSLPRSNGDEPTCIINIFVTSHFLFATLNNNSVCYTLNNNPVCYT